MGILNVTPDSFSDGRRFLSPKKAITRALEMERQGADIIDIGGESTRPGSKGVSVKEEIKRTVPVVKKLVKRLKIPVSIDTTKYEVAETALEAGASIVNDVSGLRSDEKIAALCGQYSAGLVLMHMKGTPRSMQKRPAYKNLLRDIRDYLKSAARIAEKNGVSKENIVIDPGIGFGKTLKHNLKLLDEVKFFKRLGLPVLIGLSRKSFMGKLLGLKTRDRLIPTVAANAIAVYNGADIIRVHDIKEAVIAARIAEAISLNKGRL